MLPSWPPFHPAVFYKRKNDCLKAQQFLIQWGSQKILLHSMEHGYHCVTSVSEKENTNMLCQRRYITGHFECSFLKQLCSRAMSFSCFTGPDIITFWRKRKIFCSELWVGANRCNIVWSLSLLCTLSSKPLTTTAATSFQTSFFALSREVLLGGIKWLYHNFIFSASTLWRAARLHASVYLKIAQMPHWCTHWCTNK